MTTSTTIRRHGLKNYTLLLGTSATNSACYWWAAKQLLDEAFDEDLERNALVEVLQLHQRNLVACVTASGPTTT